MQKYSFEKTRDVNISRNLETTGGLEWQGTERGGLKYMQYLL